MLRTFNLVAIQFHRLMSNMASTSKVAIVQITAGSDKDANFSVCRNLIEKAKENGAKMVFLPECFDYVAANRQQLVEQAEEMSGPLVARYKSLAQELSVWISLGGMHRRADPAHVHNTHLVINSAGEIVATYDKTHLFNVDIPGNVRLREADFCIPGMDIPDPIQTPVGNVGLGICYDLRFPDFSLRLRKRGAEILTYPSAFTQSTGAAHWEVLLRNRAIESQCYVIAAAQEGHHNPKRASYGHAMVVDPWGCVIAQCGNQSPNLAIAEIDLNYLRKVRQELPVFSHRRADIYTSPVTLPIDGQDEYQFGTVQIKSTQIFLRTELSMAFVNRKPVVLGHSLVSPLRPVKRVEDMTPEELTDFFQTVQRVQKVLEKEHKTESTTLTIQDGADAGQTIPHVHMHLLPRHPNDFEENNEIYVELQKHDKNDHPSKWRSQENMAEEARHLRTFFYQTSP